MRATKYWTVTSGVPGVGVFRTLWLIHPDCLTQQTRTFPPFYLHNLCISYRQRYLIKVTSPGQGLLLHSVFNTLSAASGAATPHGSSSVNHHQQQKQQRASSVLAFENQQIFAELTNQDKSYYGNPESNDFLWKLHLQDREHIENKHFWSISRPFLMQGKTWRPLWRRYSPVRNHGNKGGTWRDTWTFTTLLLLQ